MPFIKRRKSPNKSVYAFIDSQNLNLGVQKMGWKMDWRKFRKMLADEYGVTKAYMFIGYVAENEKLYEQIHEAGYLVVLKPTVDPSKFHDKPEVASANGEEEKRQPVKGNIDAELVLWAMKEINSYSKAVVVSGDGDFFCLVEYLKQQNKLAKILTPNWQYSSLLRAFDDDIVRLDQKRNQLQYRTFKKSQNRKPNGQNNR